MITHVTCEIEVCSLVTISGSARTTIEASANASATASRTVALCHRRAERARAGGFAGTPGGIGPPGAGTLDWSIIRWSRGRA
jgi:hypothetical protein